MKFQPFSEDTNIAIQVDPQILVMKGLLHYDAGQFDQFLDCCLPLIDESLYQLSRARPATKKGRVIQELLIAFRSNAFHYRKNEGTSKC
jgi:hypothetical protein